MTSSIANRCDPRFPWRGAVLDASAIVRFRKCDALRYLEDTVPLYVAGQVAREVRRAGPSARAGFERLDPRIVPVKIGSPANQHVDRMRGGKASTRDLGEVESIAVALVLADEGTKLPFVVYDATAARLALGEGLEVVDFVDTLAWLVNCGVMSVDAANEVEELAAMRDGWRRPEGSLEALIHQRRGRFSSAAGA